MRWFWLFILGLCILTGALYAQRRSTEQAAAAQLQAEAEAQRASTPARRPRAERGSRSAGTDAPTNPRASDPTPSENAEAATGSDATQTPDRVTLEPEPVEVAEAGPNEQGHDQDKDQDTDQGQEQHAGGFDPSGLITTMNEMGDQLPSERRAKLPSSELKPATNNAAAQTAQTQADQAAPDTSTQPEPVGEIVIDLPQGQQGEQAEEAAEAAKSYEQRADGSFRVIDANVWVQGAGTEAEPYVLGWDVLKSIEKSYNPKAGKDTIPGWLDLLDGKVVSIEGNTLVPVVASTTRELLVMQNPWDGCCIGVPPTPYDAVEVTLNHDVDFGNSAVGYGSVEGTFYVDPYVVDGWVLGIYIIENAKYRSGEGVTFPEF